MDIAKSSPSAIAERIYALADAAGIKRRGLPRWLSDQCETSVTACQNWLKGDNAPNSSNVEVIARALGSSPSYIMFGDSAAPTVALPQTLPLASGSHACQQLDSRVVQHARAVIAADKILQAISTKDTKPALLAELEAIARKISG